MQEITHDTTGTHPIERIMATAITKIKALVDTDTIVGTPMTTIDGTIVIPVSKVSMGFVTGGGEYDSTMKDAADFPFAGGSGAGVAVTPIGFLVGQQSNYRMVSMDTPSAYDKLLEMVPQLIDTMTREGR